MAHNVKALLSDVALAAMQLSKSN